jgi:hypothetical protein
MFYLVYFLYIFHLIHGNVETLHFESGCLKESNLIELHLRCSLYEHIELIRVIYGYSKQQSMHRCQFSIYDCIQEGASRNILSCNGKQTCIINLTKNEILSTTVLTNGVPGCSDFNYVQINFGCIPDAKDICDSWKDDRAIIHLSHTRSRDKIYNECQCKVRSSLLNGQVLLQAREINRQFASLKNFQSIKNSNTDCKKTTYLEIATDRSERKCMDNLPSNGNALFGSGSHNFTLTYVRNDPFSELFFYFELKASPAKKDHHVQIICNWARRTTTIHTTLPITHKRRLTTISMLRGGQLSRLDLIRHPSISDDEIHDLEIDEDTNEPSINIDETTTTVINDEEENLTTDIIIKSKKDKIKISTTIPMESTTILTSSISDNDDEWSRILSVAGIEPPSSSSKQLFSSNDRTLLSSVQASILSTDQTFSDKISKHKLLIILLLVSSTTILIFSLYCIKVKQPNFIQRLKLNINVAFLFCCEAGKLLFSSSNTSQSLSSTPTGTIKRHHHHQSLPLPIADHQSSEYYMNNTAINCHTMQSIYDDDDDDDGGGDGGKSIYNINDDDDDGREGSEYMTRYDRCHEGDTC